LSNGRALLSLTKSIHPLHGCGRVAIDVVVVHHSFCGTSSYMPERVFKKFNDEYHADISTLFDPDSVAIPDFEKSLRYDLELLRSSPAVPKHVKLYGFFCEINSGKLIEVLRDIPALIAA
jgi:carbonic anhydrase